MAYRPPLYGGITGNTAGNNAIISTGTMHLAGGNNVTLSQTTGVNGGTISINAGAGGGGVGLSAGTQSVSTGTVVFSNSNGVSFGMSGSSRMTASHNGLTSQSNQALSASNGSFAFQTAGFSNANGVTFGTSAGSVMTASVNTSYAASNHSHGNPTLNLTNLSGTTASASNGLTLSLSAANPGITTARASNDAIGLNTAGTNVTWTANSSGVSFNGAGYAGTGFSGTNASGTMNSNGLQLSVSAGGGGGVALSAGGALYSSGTLNLNNAGGALTMSTNPSSVLNMSVPAMSSLSATGALGLSTNGNTISIGAPATSSMVGINGITLSTSGSTISISGNGAGGGVSWGGIGGTLSNQTDLQGELDDKRDLVPRLNSITSSATPSINTDTTDQFNITALATDITSMTTNLSGTPVDGQKLLIRITGTATRTITWGSSFASSGVATLLAATSGTLTHMIGLIYDGVDGKWVCMAVDATGY